MIQDVDDTLKELLVQQVPIKTADIDIKFDTPTKEWSATVTKPTVNLFLYDVRENHELRTSERTVTRADKTGTITRAAIRVDLSYLISVWTTDISDEHQLLGRILTALVQFPQLPADVLKGAMQSQAFPVHAWIAQPERSPNPWEFWGHMDHGMKAALNYVLTASVQPFAVEQVKLATTSVINLTSESPSQEPRSSAVQDARGRGVETNRPRTNHHTVKP